MSDGEKGRTQMGTARATLEIGLIQTPTGECYAEERCGENASRERRGVVGSESEERAAVVNSRPDVLHS